MGFIFNRTVIGGRAGGQALGAATLLCREDGLEKLSDEKKCKLLQMQVSIDNTRLLKRELRFHIRK